MATNKVFEGVWLGHDSDRSRNDSKFHEGGGVMFVVNDKATFLDALRKKRIRDKHLV